MLVKVAKGVFLNPDNVSAVILGEDKASVFTIDDAIAWEISFAGASYLMEHMDAAGGITLPGEDGYVNPETMTAPLTARIAQYLRDDVTEGSDFNQIARAISGVTSEQVHTALFDLMEEHVVIVNDPGLGLLPLYHHASHRPNKPAPKREMDIIQLTDQTAFTTAVRNGEFQCIECQHQTCATCVTASACCQCNQPAFTVFTSRALICPTCEHVICSDCSGANAVPPRRGCCQCDTITPTNSLFSQKQLHPFNHVPLITSCYVCQHTRALHSLSENNCNACSCLYFVPVGIKNFMPNPDPSTEGAALESHPGADSES